MRLIKKSCRKLGFHSWKRADPLLDDLSRYHLSEATYERDFARTDQQGQQHTETVRAGGIMQEEVFGFLLNKAKTIEVLIMKKWLCLMLVVLLFATATVVMAEEAVNDLPPSGLQSIATPDIPFGEKLPGAMEKIEDSFEYSSIQFSGSPVQSTRTLSNGKQYQEFTMSGTAADDSYQLEAKFYFTSDRMTIAAIQEYIVTDAIDLSNAGIMLDTSLGTPALLDLEAHGDYAELLGEAAHLENGQNLWHYTKDYNVIGEDGFLIESIPITIYVTMKIIDNHLYLAEFMDPNALSSKGQQTTEALDVKGFDQLTPEEQKAVSLYAEYLEASKQAQLEQYVAFLLNKH